MKGLWEEEWRKGRSEETNSETIAIAREKILVTWMREVVMYYIKLQDKADTITDKTDVECKCDKMTQYFFS